MAAPFQPRWSFHVPTLREVNEFLAAQTGAGNAPAHSYADVGATADDTRCPAGYNLDHNRALIGHGDADFETACAAVRGWRMFPAPWTRISPANAPIAVGTVVAMQAHAVGLWWLNACRIVYVLDEDSGGTELARRFGFAYGTLLAHVEEGEERFSVELRRDGSVWYDLRAFSRPRYWPVRIAKPLARRLQARFVRDSKAAMSAAVRGGRKVTV